MLVWFLEPFAIAEVISLASEPVPFFSVNQAFMTLTPGGVGTPVPAIVEVARFVPVAGLRAFPSVVYTRGASPLAPPGTVRASCLLLVVPISVLGPNSAIAATGVSLIVPFLTS